MTTKYNPQNKCPSCGRSLALLEIALSKIMVRSLFKVYKWALDKNQELVDFDMKEVKALFSHSEYARFGDLVHFSDMILKRGKAKYSIDIPKVERFLAGDIMIPIAAIKNPATKQIEYTKWGTTHDVPSVMEFLNEEGNYIPRYYKKII